MAHQWAVIHPSAWVVALIAVSPSNSRGEPIGPTAFGRVFREHHGALVRVRGAEAERRPATGFVVGAHGEVIFGARKRPESTLKLVAHDGLERDADLLGWDQAMGLAVARPRAGSKDARDHAAEAVALPLRFATSSRLDPERWVVVFTQGGGGKPEPFAGVVEGKERRTPARQSSLQIFLVAVPGDSGSPVLSTEGKLVGVVVEGGARKSRVVPVEAVLDFLKAVAVDG